MEVNLSPVHAFRRSLRPLKCIAALMTLALLPGCGAYKVAIQSGEELKADAQEVVSVEKQNRFSQGFQCFEPMLFFITVGIVPMHCVDTYKVSVASADGPSRMAAYDVTRVQGWAALFLLPLPSWHYSFGNQTQVEPEIEGLVRGDK